MPHRYEGGVKTLRIAFTGTQDGMAPTQREAVAGLMERLMDETSGWVSFGHGDCVGADAEFHALAVLLMADRARIGIEAFPCTITHKRAFSPASQLAIIHPPKDPMSRNTDIANWTDILIAAPKEPEGEVIRSGTWSTVRRGRKAGRRIYIVRPSGAITEEDHR